MAFFHIHCADWDFYLMIIKCEGIKMVIAGSIQIGKQVGIVNKKL